MHYHSIFEPMTGEAVNPSCAQQGGRKRLTEGGKFVPDMNVTYVFPDGSTARIRQSVPPPIQSGKRQRIAEEEEEGVGGGITVPAGDFDAGGGGGEGEVDALELDLHVEEGDEEEGGNEEAEQDYIVVQPDLNSDESGDDHEGEVGS